eukprot:2666336-Lingulodinium_polyedra.AAC.1
METAYRLVRPAADAAQAFASVERAVDVAARAGIDRSQAAKAGEDSAAIAVWRDWGGAIELPPAAAARPPE